MANDQGIVSLLPHVDVYQPSNEVDDMTSEKMPGDEDMADMIQEAANKFRAQLMQFQKKEDSPEQTFEQQSLAAFEQNPELSSKVKKVATVALNDFVLRPSSAMPVENDDGLDDIVFANELFKSLLQENEESEKVKSADHEEATSAEPPTNNQNKDEVMVSNLAQMLLKSLAESDKTIEASLAHEENTEASDIAKLLVQSLLGGPPNSMAAPQTEESEIMENSEENVDETQNQPEAQNLEVSVDVEPSEEVDLLHPGKTKKLGKLEGNLNNIHAMIVHPAVSQESIANTSPVEKNGLENDSGADIAKMLLVSLMGENESSEQSISPNEEVVSSEVKPEEKDEGTDTAKALLQSLLGMSAVPEEPDSSLKTSTSSSAAAEEPEHNEGVDLAKKLIESLFEGFQKTEAKTPAPKMQESSHIPIDPKVRAVYETAKKTEVPFEPEDNGDELKLWAKHLLGLPDQPLSEEHMDTAEVIQESMDPKMEELPKPVDNNTSNLQSAAEEIESDVLKQAKLQEGKSVLSSEQKVEDSATSVAPFSNNKSTFIKPVYARTKKLSSNVPSLVQSLQNSEKKTGISTPFSSADFHNFADNLPQTSLSSEKDFSDEDTILQEWFLYKWMKQMEDSHQVSNGLSNEDLAAMNWLHAYWENFTGMDWLIQLWGDYAEGGEKVALWNKVSAMSWLRRFWADSTKPSNTVPAWMFPAQKEDGMSKELSAQVAPKKTIAETSPFLEKREFFQENALSHATQSSLTHAAPSALSHAVQSADKPVTSHLEPIASETGGNQPHSSSYILARAQIGKPALDASPSTTKSSSDSHTEISAPPQQTSENIKEAKSTTPETEQSQPHSSAFILAAQMAKTLNKVDSFPQPQEDAVQSSNTSPMVSPGEQPAIHHEDPIKTITIVPKVGESSSLYVLPHSMSEETVGLRSPESDPITVSSVHSTPAVSGTEEKNPPSVGTSNSQFSVSNSQGPLTFWPEIKFPQSEEDSLTKSQTSTASAPSNVYGSFGLWPDIKFPEAQSDSSPENETPKTPSAVSASLFPESKLPEVQSEPPTTTFENIPSPIIDTEVLGFWPVIKSPEVQPVPIRTLSSGSGSQGSLGGLPEIELPKVEPDYPITAQSPSNLFPVKNSQGPIALSSEITTSEVPQEQGRTAFSPEITTSGSQESSAYQYGSKVPEPEEVTLKQEERGSVLSSPNSGPSGVWSDLKMRSSTDLAAPGTRRSKTPVASMEKSTKAARFSEPIPFKSRVVPNTEPPKTSLLSKIQDWMSSVTPKSEKQAVVGTEPVPGTKEATKKWTPLEAKLARLPPERVERFKRGGDVAEFGVEEPENQNSMFEQFANVNDFMSLNAGPPTKKSDQKISPLQARLGRMPHQNKDILERKESTTNGNFEERPRDLLDHKTSESFPQSKENEGPKSSGGKESLEASHVLARSNEQDDWERNKEFMQLNVERLPLNTPLSETNAVAAEASTQISLKQVSVKSMHEASTVLAKSKELTQFLSLNDDADEAFGNDGAQFSGETYQKNVSSALHIDKDDLDDELHLDEMQFAKISKTLGSRKRNIFLQSLRAIPLSILFCFAVFASVIITYYSKRSQSILARERLLSAQHFSQNMLGRQRISSSQDYSIYNVCSSQEQSETQPLLFNYTNACLSYNACDYEIL